MMILKDRYEHCAIPTEFTRHTSGLTGTKNNHSLFKAKITRIFVVHIHKVPPPSKKKEGGGGGRNPQTYRQNAKL